jgi:hypothetical protein
MNISKKIQKGTGKTSFFKFLNFQVWRIISVVKIPTLNILMFHH